MNMTPIESDRNARISEFGNMDAQGRNNELVALTYEGARILLGGKQYSISLNEQSREGRSISELAGDQEHSRKIIQDIALVIVSKELSNALNGLIARGITADTVTVKEQTQIRYTNFRGLEVASVERNDFEVLADILKDIVETRSDIKSLPAKVMTGLAQLDGPRYNNKSPFLKAIAELSRDMESIVGFLEPKHFQSAFLSALAAGVHPDLTAAIVSRTPFVFRGLVRRWISSGEIPALALTLLPHRLTKNEIPSIFSMTM